MSLYRPRKRRVEINVVPLVDVMVVLIFFFIMTMKFEDVRALAITPPSAESAGRESGAQGTVIAITKDGKFFKNGTETNRETLVNFLQKEGEMLPGSYILIIADEQTLTKDTVFVLDQTNKAHLTPRLITRSTRQP